MSIRSIFRSFRTEVFYQANAGHYLVILAVVAGGVAVAVSGSVSHVGEAHRQFLRSAAELRANGIPLAEVLREPVRVTMSGTQQMIDNPTKYDYLEVGRALQAVSGPTMIATSLDLVTFLVFPLLFAVVGAYVATCEARSRTAKLRAARARWSVIIVAKLLSLTVTSAVGVLGVVAFGLLASVLTPAFVGNLAGPVDYPVDQAVSITSWPVKFLFGWFVGVFFGLVGYVIGTVTRSPAWPMVILAAALFLLPFLSAVDPRNLVAVLASRTYDFWGQFKLRPPIDTAVPTAVVLLGLYAGVAVVVTLAVALRRSRFN